MQVLLAAACCAVLIPFASGAGLNIERARVVTVGHHSQRLKPIAGANDFGSARRDQRLDAARLRQMHHGRRRQITFADPRPGIGVLPAGRLARNAHAPRPSPPTRVADVVDGHVHPSLCVTQSGDLLAVYNKSGGGGKELLLCRSRDGGRTWSSPTAIPVIKDCSIYPGSLTTLRDGRIVLHWSCYRVQGERRCRVPQFCVSDDEGKTWSEPRNLPIDDHTNYSCLRHPILEFADGRWLCPLYDRTIVYDPHTHAVRPFGDGRNHGMVPIVLTAKGTIISGAPQADSPVPVGKPGETVRGLRSVDGGASWEALHALPYFGVAGYDLTVLDSGWIVLTSIVYGVGNDGEWSYELIISRDDGLTWDHPNAVEIYNPGRRIAGRGWPRTVQLDTQTLGTLFYDLDPNQSRGPGLHFVRTPIGALEVAN